MRVALAVDAIEPHLTGIGRYNFELARGLVRRPEVTELRFFRGNRPIPDPDALLETGGLVPGTLWNRWWKRRRDLREVRAWRQHIVHAPNFFLPKWADRGVATIHDLSVFRFPGAHPTARLEDYERRFEHSLARSAKIITGTRAMRDEIVSTLGLSPARVAVIPHGVRRIEDPGIATVESALGALGLTIGGYVLCVATIEPRKRIGQLIEAFSQLPLRERLHTPLVLIGKNGWLADDIVEQIYRASGEGWLKWFGFVADDLLDRLYRGAALFVYPSLYEGFGLPPVEAMARDIPVLISNDASLVEVSGRAAMIIEAEDPTTFSLAIRRGLEDRQWRERAVSKGAEIVDALDWADTVARTVALYQSLG